MQQLKIWIVIKQSTNLELNEPIDEVVMNVKRLTHSQQQPQVQKLTKRSQQSDKQSEQFSVPSKDPFLTDSWSWMKSSARNTLSNQQAQPKEAETVNLTENDAKSLSRLLVWLPRDVYLTLHLLLFRQSM